VALSPEAHEGLVAQLVDHDVERVYSALVRGVPGHDRGVVDAPIGRSRRNPMRMTVTAEGRPARTHFVVEEGFEVPEPLALLTCRLETGRTHQIRVHLDSIGHPVIGDDLYGPRRSAVALDRPFLHARRLSFDHPVTGERLSFESPLPEDLRAVLDGLRAPGSGQPG
jgi:23S rRNA pseudouridine1911/1915/1917 synthase